MTATNHSLTGAIIGLTLGIPILAIPLAFMSHFLLDSFPHFGFSNLNERGTKFTKLLLIDASLCALLVMVLSITRPEFWVVASLSAFAAASPDFMWAPDYFRQRNGSQQLLNSNFVKRYHSRIQWYQRPPGAIIEVLYAAGMLATLVKVF